MGKWKFAQVAQAEDLDGRWLADLAKRAAKLGHDVAGLDIEELEELIRGPADEPELAIVVGPEEPLRVARALVAKVTDPEIAEMVGSVEEAYELLSKALDLIPESMTDLQEEVLSWLAEEWGSKAEAVQIERQESYRFDSWPIAFAGFEPGQQLAKAEAVVAAEAAEEVSMQQRPVSVMDVAELKAECRERGLRGYSHLRRTALQAKVQGARNGQEEEVGMMQKVADVVAEVVENAKIAMTETAEQPVTITEQVAEQVVTNQARIAAAMAAYVPLAEIAPAMHPLSQDPRRSGIRGCLLQIGQIIKATGNKVQWSRPVQGLNLNTWENQDKSEIQVHLVRTK